MWARGEMYIVNVFLFYFFLCVRPVLYLTVTPSFSSTRTPFSWYSSRVSQKLSLSFMMSASTAPPRNTMCFRLGGSSIRILNFYEARDTGGIKLNQWYSLKFPTEGLHVCSNSKNQPTNIFKSELSLIKVSGQMAKEMPPTHTILSSFHDLRRSILARTTNKGNIIKIQRFPENSTRSRYDTTFSMVLATTQMGLFYKLKDLTYWEVVCAMNHVSVLNKVFDCMIVFGHQTKSSFIIFHPIPLFQKTWELHVEQTTRTAKASVKARKSQSLSLHSHCIHFHWNI